MIPLPMLHTLVTVLALITIIDLAVTVAGMLEFEPGARFRLSGGAGCGGTRRWHVAVGLQCGIRQDA